MKKNLILITKHFPYGTGETFLENEIGILAQYIEKIYILVYQAEMTKIKRNIPENVIVIPLECKTKKEKLSSYLRLFLMGQIPKEILSESKKYKALSSKRKCISFGMETLLKEVQARKSLERIWDNRKEFIVYSYWLNDTAYLGYRLLKHFGEVKKTPFVSRAHGYDLYKERNGGEEFPFREQILDAVTKVYPCSQQGTAYLQREYPAYQSKIERQYLGVFENRADKMARRKDGKFHIVTCSNLIPLKRVMRLAQTLNKIEKEDSKIAANLKWTCFGDGISAKELQCYCKENLSKIEVEFKGSRKQKEILEFYRSEKIDIFINVSETEGLPVSIMEAMASGIPAIATNVGGTLEIVSHGENGIMLEKDFSNEQLAAAIREIYDLDSEKKEQMASNAYARWEACFNAEKNYREFLEQIENLL